MTNWVNRTDLVVWSQTSWRWLEVKLTELGLLAHPRFRFAFVLDKECMFKVKTFQKQKKELVEHYVKPLQLIWSLLGPQWNERNTVHVDDLSRNFVMNPRNGIPVKAFYIKEGSNPTSDRELFDLAKYLINIASQADLSAPDHPVRLSKLSLVYFHTYRFTFCNTEMARKDLSLLSIALLLYQYSGDSFLILGAIQMC